MRFQLHFVILAGPDNLVILDQATPREVLRVDVMQALKHSVLKQRGQQRTAPQKVIMALELRSRRITTVSEQYSMNVEVVHQPGPATAEMPETVLVVESWLFAEAKPGPGVAGVVSVGRGWVGRFGSRCGVSTVICVRQSVEITVGAFVGTHKD